MPVFERAKDRWVIKPAGCQSRKLASKCPIIVQLWSDQRKACKTRGDLNCQCTSHALRVSLATSCGPCTTSAKETKGENHCGAFVMDPRTWVPEGGGCALGFPLLINHKWATPSRETLRFIRTMEERPEVKPSRTFKPGAFRSFGLPRTRRWSEKHPLLGCVSPAGELLRHSKRLVSRSLQGRIHTSSESKEKCSPGDT